MLSQPHPRKYEAPLPVQSHRWLQVFQFLLSHHEILQPENKKKNLFSKKKVILGFLFTSTRYPLEFMSSLTKQQAVTVPVASAKLLVSPLSTHLLVRFAAPLSFFSKFLEGSGKANALTQGTSPCVASANKLPGETLN